MRDTHSPLAWARSELAADCRHLVTVGPEFVDRLAAEMPTDAGWSPGEDELDGRTELFRLSARSLLIDLAEQILDRAQNGPGFAFVVGDALERVPTDLLRALLYGITVMLGQPMTQNPAGDRIVSVRDEHPGGAARGYRTNQPLLMHTDAADMAGLICLSQGGTGGVSLLASSRSVHDVLAEMVPELLPEYYRSWEWDLRGQQPAGGRPTVSSPIFGERDGRIFCRYASALLRGGPAKVGAGLTDLQRSALDLFEEVAHDPELVLAHTMRRGESLWLNNYAVLHGREAFTDHAGTGDIRHLLRTWLWLHDGPDVPDGFASPRSVY